MADPLSMYARGVAEHLMDAAQRDRGALLELLELVGDEHWRRGVSQERARCTAVVRDVSDTVDSDAVAVHAALGRVEDRIRGGER